MFDLQGMISAKCKPSIHSILSCSFQSMNHTVYENVIESVSTNTNENIHTNKKYKFDNAPPDFMNNEMWRSVMLELIEVYSTSRNQQCEIDSVYTQFCDVVFNEMGKYLQYSLAVK